MDLNKVKATVDSSVWCEKYKPATIDDVLIEPILKDKFNDFIKSGEIQNLMFQGTSGNGKTTCAKIIAHAVSDDVLFINASSETGIDVVRTKIIPYCTVQTFGEGTKVVILDEMEQSSEQFQTALREVVERFYKTTRFIFTCNFYNKVIEPLKSRTQEFKFGNIKQIDILKRCIAILKEENVGYSKANVAKIVKSLGTDMRRILNMMQRLTIEKDGVKKLVPFTSLEENLLQMLAYVKDKKLTEFRKFVGETNIGYDEIVKFLFKKSFEKEFGKNWVEIVAELSETAYRLKMGVDPEITVVNGVLQIMQLIER